MGTKAFDVVKGFLTYLEKEKLTGLLPEVIGLLQAAEKQNQSTLVVESAVTLSSQEKTEIAKIIKDRGAQTDRVEYVINPDLLGGIRIGIGDKILDLSVKSKLEKIYEQI